MGGGSSKPKNNDDFHTNNNTTGEITRKLLLPHNYHVIIKGADDDYILDENEYDDRFLHSGGVFLNQKKQKYWVEINPGINCFMLFPRDFSITWGDDKRYWQWTSIKESSSTSDEVMVEVAELLEVCWLEVNGKLAMSYLSPGVKYEVVFVVKLKDTAYGWQIPVSLKLVLPNGITQQNKVSLQTKPKSQWFELGVGEFQTPPAVLPPPSPADKHHRLGQVGDFQQEKTEIQFSMFEHGGHWKRGLVIKGVIVRLCKK